MDPRKFTKEVVFGNSEIQNWFVTPYEVLWTSTRTCLTLKCVPETVGELFSNIRKSGLPCGDRVEYEVDDFYKEKPPNIHLTRASCAGTGSNLRGVNGDVIARPSCDISKRTFTEAIEDQAVATDGSPLEEDQQESKQQRTSLNEGQSAVTGEAASGQRQNSRGGVSKRNSSRKHGTGENVPLANEGPSGTISKKSRPQNPKSGGRATRRNGACKQGGRQSARLVAKATLSSIK